MIELLSYDFIRIALVAAALSGLLAPAIGTYVVQRRLSLLGDGLGHLAIAGVGLALFAGWAPLPVAVVVAVVGAVLIETLRSIGGTSGDVVLAIVFYGGLASGVLLAGLAGQGTGTLAQYLFGSLTTVAPDDLVVIAALAVVVLVAAIGLAPQLFAVCVDEQHARVLGLHVRLYNHLIIVLAALTVTMAMRTVGLLLVSALMIIPVATARQVTRGFRSGFVTAMGLGLVVAVAGVVGSFYLDAPPGPLIVVLTIVVFALSWPVGALLRRRRGLGVRDSAYTAPPTPAPPARTVEEGSTP